MIRLREALVWRFGNVRDGVRECLREQRDACNYPRWAAWLALAVWLFGHLPVTGAAAALVVATPPLALLACCLLVAGSVLAVSLACVGVWQPGRANLTFSALALLIAGAPML